jgi:hypothetical protein
LLVAIGAFEHTAERCFAWTRDNTGVDPVAEASAPAVQSPEGPYEPPSQRSARFSRGYQACLASEGYFPTSWHSVDATPWDASRPMVTP